MTKASHRQSRSYDWVSPAAIGAPLKGRSGIEYFEALRDGAIPPQPIAATIGWSVVAAQPGKICIQAEVGEHMFHGGGMIHGGVFATLLDGVTASAVMSTLAEGALCASINLNVQYLTAMREPQGRLIATGRMLQRVGKTAAAEGQVEDGQGNCLARATATILIRDP